MDEPDDHFRCVYSYTVKEPVWVKIGELEGVKPPLSYVKLIDRPDLRFSGLYSESHPLLVVRAQLFDKGSPECVAMGTSYRSVSKPWTWNEWLMLPLRYSDLKRTTVLALTIYDCARPGEVAVVGGTTISLFSHEGVFRQGWHDLRLWLGVEADGNYPTKTPGEGIAPSKLQMQRLGEKTKKHRNGQMTKVDWLDRIAFREIEQINAREKAQSEYMFLMVEFPTIKIDDKPYSNIYYEADTNEHYHYKDPKMVFVPDAISDAYLVESKHYVLARSERSHFSDRDAKPTAEIRNKLNNIIHQPPTQALSSDEKDVLWKYRYYLQGDKKALIKFLKCIDWDRKVEENEAIHMLSNWQPMDVEDALELLTPAFKHPMVRKYAVMRLAEATDEDLLLYLLQLVQALKYEDHLGISEMHKKIFHDRDMLRSLDSSSLIGQSSVVNEQSRSYRHALSMIVGDVAIGASSQRNTTLIKEAIASDPTTNFEAESQPTAETHEPELSHIDKNAYNSPQLNLFAFLIRRACSNPTLANYLFWYLSVEIEDQENIPDRDERVHDMYSKVRDMFLKALDSGSAQSKNTFHNIKNQRVFMEELVKLLKQVAKEPGNRTKKVEKFQHLLADPEAFRINFMKFDCIPLPLDPDVNIKGIVPEKATLFKSAMMPARLNFITTDDREYVAIFKNGDDLRQDQLILQMIELMDKLLQRENLDLKLTPYKTLATSTKHGFLQFIDSSTIQEILGREGSIMEFFRKHNPYKGSLYGIREEIMATYSKSCAGYCVITYILGIGDRHLDNLLITKDGHLFHIDFGYILGRDPKPMPAAMKLSKEMVDGMGGTNSNYYAEFRKYCEAAYLHLRRHANVMLNLFSLMVHASVPDIALEPDKAVKKVEDKLMLNLDDEGAVQHLVNVLDDSTTAVMPVIVDKLHHITQKLRN